MYDQKLLDFHNKMIMLSHKKSQIESRSYMSALAPERPVKQPLPDIWIEHNEFEEIYNNVFKEYYEISNTAEAEKDIKKYYPSHNSNSRYFVSDFGPKGKPIERYSSYDYCKYIYKGTLINYKELNEVKDQIIAERSKFFKNKGKIKKLINKHVEIRKSLATPCSNLPKSSLDKIFLKTYGYKTYNTDWLKKFLFMAKTGWICLPPYFFNDSLYDLKNKKFKDYNVTTYINLLPEASLALIVKDLQAESGDKFFKKGVTEKDVLESVKKQAEYERKFAEKFTLEFICSILNEKLKTFTPDPKKAKQELTIKLPYMGLDKLDDKGLESVARQIHHYYSLVDRYDKYENWFETYPMAKYYKEFSDHYISTGGSMTTSDWEEQAIKVLPAGKRDLPYFDLYYQLLSMERFSTYFDLCKYVEDIRKRDELNASIKNIENTQKKIVAQNNTIIKNQQQLYIQKERQHKESMRQAISSHKEVMRKLDEIQDSLDRDIIIYY